MALNTVGKVTPTRGAFPTAGFDPLAALVTPEQYLADPQSGASLPTINMGMTGSGSARTRTPASSRRAATRVASPPGAAAPSTLLLRPGVYFVAGGGMKLKSASARILAIPGAGAMSDADAKTTFARP